MLFYKIVYVYVYVCICEEKLGGCWWSFSWLGQGYYSFTNSHIDRTIAFIMEYAQEYTVSFVVILYN